jgi:hypothetical protein
MKRMNVFFIVAAVCLLSLVSTESALADANSDASIASKGTCASGAPLFVVVNANATQGLLVNVVQTSVVSGQTTTKALQVTVAPAGQKMLGCAAPAGAKIQISWKIQSAQYN